LPAADNANDDDDSLLRRSAPAPEVVLGVCIVVNKSSSNEPIPFAAFLALVAFLSVRRNYIYISVSVVQDEVSTQSIAYTVSSSCLLAWLRVSWLRVSWLASLPLPRWKFSDRRFRL